MPKSKEKKQKKPTSKPHARVLDAALAVAASTPWQVVSLYEIAETAGMPRDEMARLFPTKESILLAIGQRFDEAVLCGVVPEEDTTLRDKLFDIFMEKFDGVNDHRAAFKSILFSFGWDKPSTCAQIQMMGESSARLAGHGGLDVQGLNGRIQIAVLSLALVPVWWKWLHDESSDLGATMASLDKALSHFEKITGYLTPPAY